MYPMNADKNFDILSEPDIINDRKLSERRFIQNRKKENLQQNSKLKLEP